MVARLINFPLRGKYLEEKDNFEKNKNNNLLQLQIDTDYLFNHALELNQNVFEYIKYSENTYVNFPEEDIKKLFNLSNEDYKYIKVFLNYFDTIDKRLSNLFEQSHKLINQNEWLSGLTIIRSFIEASWFNTFITHKSYRHLLKEDFESFFHVFVKSNFYQKSKNIKKKLIKDHGGIISKIELKNEKGYNVMNLAEFYEKTNFIEIVEKFNEASFMNSENNLFQKSKKTTLNIFKEVPKLDLDAYKHLCDIVHPNAVYFNDPYDKSNLTDYKFIYCCAINRSLLILIKFNEQVKFKILDILMQNKKEVINFFNKDESV